MKRRGSAVLDAPEGMYASGSSDAGRSGLTGPRRAAGSVRRDLQEEFGRDFEDGFGDPDFGGPGGSESFGGGWDSPGRREGVGRRSGSRGVVRKGFFGWLPRTLWGRIGAGAGLIAALGLGVGGVLAARSALLHDERFVIPTSAAIAIEGNEHVTKAQLLSILGEDVERNIFTVPLAERRAELERLPWVERATVMRLLPNHLKVSIVERTPVAFVRQGGRIGLVDKSGVLMDMGSGAGYVSGNGEHYSFPVVTGITAEEPQSTRAARMKIFARFTSELDGGGDRISDKLSEVDLSSPEDVKALIPDEVGSGEAGKAGELLVHFGDAEFLERFKKYREHLAEWRTQYPTLASVDMRYDTQAVLKMSPDSAAAKATVAAKRDEAAAVAPAAKTAAPVVTAGAKPAPKAVAARTLTREEVGSDKPHDNLTSLGDHGAPAAAKIDRPAARPAVGSTIAAKAGTTTAVKSTVATPTAVKGPAAAAPVAKAPAPLSQPSAPTAASVPAPVSNGAVQHLMVAKAVAVKKPVAKKVVVAKKHAKPAAKKHVAAKVKP